MECFGKPRHVNSCRQTIEYIGQICCNIRFGILWKESQKTISCRFAGVVGHAWFESDGYDGIRFGSEGVGGEEECVYRSVFNDWVSKQIIDPCLDGFG